MKSSFLKIKKVFSLNVSDFPGDSVDTVPFSSRSRISGESGHLIANVQSPHAKEHRIIFDRDHNVFEFRLLESVSFPKTIFEK